MLASTKRISLDYQPGKKVPKLAISPVKLDPFYEGPYVTHTVHTNGMVTSQITPVIQECINIRCIHPFYQSWGRFTPTSCKGTLQKETISLWSCSLNTFLLFFFSFCHYHLTLKVFFFTLHNVMGIISFSLVFPFSFHYSNAVWSLSIEGQSTVST